MYRGAIYDQGHSRKPYWYCTARDKGLSVMAHACSLIMGWTRQETPVSSTPSSKKSKKQMGDDEKNDQ